MKLSSLLISALLCSAVFGFDANLQKEKGATGISLPKAQWKLPAAITEDGTIDPSKLPADSIYVKQVILGSEILNKTHLYIGPNAKDETKRYAGNHLSCSSCHAKGGTVQNQSGYVGIYARFPQYNARGDKVVTLTDRINGCMQRSMNGKVMPPNSPEIKAMLAYMHWISQGVSVGAHVEGEGLANVALIDRAADPAKGKVIYEEKCVACHGANGEGMQNPDWKSGDYYLYPPLWGNDSYNTGAGMYRLIKAAQYIKHNMPQFDATLSDEEAFDVASYINTQPRPVKSNREADFPDRKVKPADMDVGPYNDSFTIEQHKFGPYKPMMK